jgi:Na+-translocating ferredoxin:NAD+ oxidoreductase RnfG subunit
MMIVFHQILLALALLNPGHSRTTQRELDLAGENIQRVFPGADHIERHTMALTPAEAESLLASTGRVQHDSLIEFMLPMDGKRVVGYAIIDNVPGKDQPITYLVQFTPDLEIRDIAILAYRESYGGEIRNTSWLEQFRQKKPGDTLRPGKEIRNITGATISSRSVTQGVGRILALLKMIGHRLPGRSGR